jgi:parvulin-like peptidyl-prolyl isomerase
VFIALLAGAAAAEEKTVASETKDNDIVVVVNGQPITAFKFYAELEDKAGSQILQNLIMESLILQEVEKQKLSITDNDIAQQLETLRKQFPNDQSFQYALMGVSQAELYSQLKVQAALWKLGTRNVTITDDELTKYFEEHKDEYKEPEEVRARHILVKTEDEAKKIISQLDAGGDFAELAKANGLDGTKDTGGDLGFFTYGDMVPEFSKAAFALEIGKYTKEPVKTQFGFHVIKLEERKEEKVHTFDEVKEQVRQAILKEKATPSQQIMEELVKNAKLDWKWERYSNLFGTLAPASAPSQEPAK